MGFGCPMTRGSWSKEVKAEHLRPFGEPIHPGTRQSVAKRPHDVALRPQAKTKLLRQHVIFNDGQIECVGRGFEELVAQIKIIVYAVAIMPDHVHLVYPRGTCDAEEFVGMFKRAGSRALRKERLHPFLGEDERRSTASHEEAEKTRPSVDAANKIPRVDAGAKRYERLPTPWGEKAWHVFLHDEDEIRQRIEYVNDNPVKAGRPEQRWGFVTRFEER